MLRHFSEDRGRLYQDIADKAGSSYARVRALAHTLKADRPAHVAVIPFDGCRLFLNDRGRRVKRAAELLEDLRSHSDSP